MNINHSEKWGKNLQAMAYNGMRTVCSLIYNYRPSFSLEWNLCNDRTMHNFVSLCKLCTSFRFRFDLFPLCIYRTINLGTLTVLLAIFLKYGFCKKSLLSEWTYFHHFGVLLVLKVSWFQNVLLVPSNLPKNPTIFFQDFCPSL